MVQEELQDGGFIGYLNIDFEKRTDNNLNYFYARPEMASYTSIVNQTETVEVDNIYEYLAGKPTLAKAYYTALGRERYGIYRPGGVLNEQLEID